MKLYDPADYVTIDEVQHSGNVYVECGHVDAVYPVSSCSVAISPASRVGHALEAAAGVAQGNVQENGGRRWVSTNTGRSLPWVMRGS